MPGDAVRYSKHESIATIRVNRPGKYSRAPRYQQPRKRSELGS